MANYILKNENSKFSVITLNRKIIGKVREDDDGTWSGYLTDNGTNATVRGFSGRSNAFYSLTQTLKVFALNKRAGLTLVAPNVSNGDEFEEITHRNRSIEEYVRATNAHAGKEIMRVVTRRRR